MSNLRETVIVKTPAGDLPGELFIGTDGLPELGVRHPATVIGDRISQAGITPQSEHYRPATFPATWSLRCMGRIGALFNAWLLLGFIRTDIRAAQREAEVEPCRQGDGHVSHDFVGEHCIRCGLSDRDQAQQRDSDDIEAYKRDAEVRGGR